MRDLDETLRAPLAALTEALQRARRIVALTGAGASTDSGIPDFRSDDGLWGEHDPMAVASIEGFRQHPARFYAFWKERFRGLVAARPNITHRVLAALEARGLLRAVVTQNIDGLHHKGGSREVMEVHGSAATASCIACRRAAPVSEVLAQVAADRVPRCAACGGLVKPDVVLFGEDLPPAIQAAAQAVAGADLLVVLGSSLEVHPVAGLVPHAASHGTRVAIVNREPTSLDHLADVVVHASLSPVMRHLDVALDLRLE